MDIMTGLSAAAQAIKITKDLRDIERDLDSASYEAQMAELYSNLADVKIALSDAKEALHERDTSIQRLKAEIEALKSGETCPICQTGKMKVTASVEDPFFGVFGHQQRTLTCQTCGHAEKRKVDPDARR